MSESDEQRARRWFDEPGERNRQLLAAEFAAIRRNERAKVEREVAEWLESDGAHVHTIGVCVRDGLRNIAQAIRRGESGAYRQPATSHCHECGRDGDHKLACSRREQGARLAASSEAGEVCDCHPAENTGGGHSASCPAFEAECTCYESIGGHQPGCHFTGRAARDGGE